jgi:catechol 2,3-dioxygenase-like lactoylglutathione lyase family enzyme
MARGGASTMLDDSPLYVVIPVSDLDDARHFYEDVLGIPSVRESETEILYRAGDTRFAVYPSEGAGSARHTLGSFIVEDIETVAAELRSRGVVFEEYDTPELKTVEGIARLGPDKVAFFKDPSGNILALVQEDVF